MPVSLKTRKRAFNFAWTKQMLSDKIISAKKQKATKEHCAQQL